MTLVLPALLVLVVVAIGLAWFIRAKPSALARSARMSLGFLAAAGIGLLLVFGIRLVPGLLPELMGLAGVAIAVLLVRYLRRRPAGGFSSPGAGQRTEVRTAFLQAWIDHGSGDVGGTVLAGRFAGQGLDSLADSDLLELHRECGADPDSRRVLESYLDRRLGADWRSAQRPPADGSRADMSRDEALAVLGLSEGATEDDIRTAYRRLIQRLHPDVGGSVDLAARINRARDVLLGG